MRRVPFFGAEVFSMEEGVCADGRRRRLSVVHRFAVAVAALLLLGVTTGVIATLTVPEVFLFRERLVWNILEIKSSISLQPVDLRTHDGLTLRSWYHPPAKGKPVIVYFPGRDGDLIRKPAHLFQLAKEGYGLTLAGYRGYGGNPGQPSEQLFYRDATALLTQLSAKGLTPDGTVLYGYSMGTGVASYVATTAQARALILEAPFTSFPDAVARQVPWVPLWLVRSRFDTRSRIREIDVPILLLAGQNDTVTPPFFARKLASLSERFSKLQILPGANHLNIGRHGAVDLVAGFLFGLTEAAAAPQQPL